MSDTQVVVRKDVSCWNCFGTEESVVTSEDEVYSKAITLPKVREVHREKLKVYSFLAAELSKPKAVSLKQKVSTHYAITKKIDEQVLEQHNNETKDIVSNDDDKYSNDSSSNKEINEITANVVKFTIQDNKTAFTINEDKNIDDNNSPIICSKNHSPDLSDPSPNITIKDNNITPKREKRRIQVDFNSLYEPDDDIDRLNVLRLSKRIIRQRVASPRSPSPPLDFNEIPVFQSDEFRSQFVRPANKFVLKRQSAITSEVSEGIKFADAVDQGKETSLVKAISLDLPQTEFGDNHKSYVITKLPVLKQTMNSRYSPIYKLKRSFSKDSAIIDEDVSDNDEKFVKGTITPKISAKSFDVVNPKKQEFSIKRNTISNTSTTSTKETPNKLSADKISPFTRPCRDRDITSTPKIKNTELSKTSKLTSPRMMSNVTPPVLKRNIEKESVSPIHRLPRISTEKKSILKRKSSDLSIGTRSNISTDSNYGSETTDDLNVSLETHRKYPKTDIGTKLPVLKQNMNSKYSPLNKVKQTPSTEMLSKGKNETDSNLFKQSDVKDKKICKEKKLETEDNVDRKRTKEIQPVTSTPKSNEIDDEISVVSDKLFNLSLKNTPSLQSMSGSSTEFSTDEYKNISKSEAALCANVEIKKSPKKEVNFDLSNTGNKKFSQSRSISTDALGKILCPTGLRRSTLSMDPRSFRYEDDMYISEGVSGHATLPRRSNSPLPHERDVERERFPLNRSGLQTRSESMASVYSGAGEGGRGGVPVRGEVQFSLVYNYRLGALEVGVKRCRDLAPIDQKKNRSDPYVKVYLLPDKSKTGKRKTKVKKNTLNPVFEETLSFTAPLESLTSRAVWLSAWHADMFGRNDFLGEVTLPLAGRLFDDPAPVWYPLTERTELPEEAAGTRGDLIVGLKLDPDSRTLHVLVKEARGLVPSRAGSLADVFCKAYLLPERGRLHKRKTAVCRRTLAPVWRTQLTYSDVTSAALTDRALELTLWDRDRLASNEFLGAVRLSLGTGVHRGENVSWMDSAGKEVTLWQTMLQQPNFWVEGSLPLRPHLNN